MTQTSKIALVTGASRGIGRAIALALGQQGFIVAGTATTDDGAQRISDYLAEHKISGQGFAANVSDDDSVAQLLTAVSEQLGAPVVVVNNAGVTRDNLLMRMKSEEWDAVINTNLTSIYLSLIHI